MATCFVCMDDADPSRPLRVVCRCATCVHEDCFQALVRSVPAHRTRCPVCLHEFAHSLAYPRWRCLRYVGAALGWLLVAATIPLSRPELLLPACAACGWTLGQALVLRPERVVCSATSQEKAIAAATS